MISLGPRLLFEFPPSTSSRAETQQQPRSQGNNLSAPCGIIYYYLVPSVRAGVRANRGRVNGKSSSMAGVPRRGHTVHGSGNVMISIEGVSGGGLDSYRVE